MTFIESEGSLLVDRYRLERRIGGTTSRVWFARDTALERGVAVKLVAGESSSAVSRACALARLTHPGLVMVIDVDVVDSPSGPVLYVVTEFLVGESLATLLGRGPLSWRQAIGICADVASALAVVHRAGLVHGDLRPEHVIVTPNGTKLLGFAGMGKSGSFADGDRYRAPELTREGRITPAADLYALGAILAEALTGRGESRARLPEDVPHGVAKLCVRSLAVDPDLRPSAGEMASGLAQAGQVETQWFPPVPPSRSPTARPRRSAHPPHVQGAARRGRHAAAAARRRAGRHVAAQVTRRPAPSRQRIVEVGLAAAVIVVLALTAFGVLHSGGMSNARNALPPVGAAPDPGTPDAPGPGPGTPSESPSAPAAGPSSPPSPREPQMMREVYDPASVLIDLQVAIDDGDRCGQIRPDVGVDLTNIVTGLRRQVAQGRTYRLASEASELEAKIGRRVREHGITRGRARVLDEFLSYLT
jgi:serine/threonine-protein kinase